MQITAIYSVNKNNFDLIIMHPRYIGELSQMGKVVFVNLTIEEAAQIFGGGN